MQARTRSIKENVILSAWKKTGIRPFNPQIFTDEDFGPSFASSTNRPLPKSFPVPNTNSTSLSELSYSSDDGTYNGSHDEDSNSRDSESEEGKSMEREKMDTMAADHPLNQDNQLDFPISAESTTLLSQHTTPLSLINVEDCRLLCEEGGREQPRIGHSYHPHRQTSQPPCTPVYSTRRQT
jgi:hypothetical protein